MMETVKEEGGFNSDEMVLPESRNSIKLTKSSRGYGWAIKIYSDDADSMIKTIETINKQMVDKFGVPNE